MIETLAGIEQKNKALQSLVASLSEIVRDVSDPNTKCQQNLVCLYLEQIGLHIRVRTTSRERAGQAIAECGMRNAELKDNEKSAFHIPHSAIESPTP